MIDLRRLSALAGLLLAAACSTCKKPAETPPPSAAHVTVDGRKVEVTLILTEKARRHATEEFATPAPGKGYLMGWPRERFCKIESEPLPATFDVAFLDRSGKILELRALKAGDREGIQPIRECAYALFVAPGALDLKTGGTVELPPEARSPQELPVVKIGDHTAYVELSLTGRERNHGLMFRPRMSENDGMLFAYDREGFHSFWMANTLIPLDIAFFKEDGTLINVNPTPMYPDPRQPPTPHPTSDAAAPARYVLEMNLGWFRRNGLVDASGQPKPGVRAQFPPEALRGEP